MATNAVSRRTRRVYSAEELHRLRNTQSQPKLSEAIEEHESEDAELVKEHVLKISRSFAARSYRGRQSTASSLRVPSSASHNENSSVSSRGAFLPPDSHGTQPEVLSDIVPNGQVLRFRPRKSPTPSLKRAAVEAIVKSHGSPNHMRVTAGGRIVPSEQSPLCQPRYGYSAIKMNGRLIKFAPNGRFGNRPQELEQATDQNGQVVEDMHGNYFQIVNHKILPLQTRPDGSMELHMAASNINMSQQQALPPHAPSMPPFRPAGQSAEPIVKNSVVVPEPSPAMQIKVLKAEHKRYEDEMRQLSQTEAVRGREMSQHDRNRLITRRRQLVTEADQVRRRIKELENRPPQDAPTSPRAMQGRHAMPTAGRGRGNFQPMLQGPLTNVGAPQKYGPSLNGPSPSFVPQFGATISPEEGFTNAWAIPPNGIFMPPPPFDGAMAGPLPNMMPLTGALAPVHSEIPQCDGARSLADHGVDSPDRSRAISIKAPEGKSGLRSVLNPMSPVYKPSMADDQKTAAPAAQRRVLTPLSPMQKPAAPVPSAVNSSIATDETDRENDNPQDDADAITPVREAWKSSAPDTGNRNDPAAPPGTPIYYSATTTHAPQPAKAESSDLRHTHADIADRQSHNISPKSRREFVLGQENGGQDGNPTFSSPPEDTSSQNCVMVGSLQEKSGDWLHGWATGLQRRAFDERPKGFTSEWLDGYCEGIKASVQPRTGPTTAPHPSTISTASLTAMSNTGSPMKAQSRRPSPAMASRSSSMLQVVENAPGMSRPPFEISTRSIDGLKQAIVAPQNENAVLTPAANGLHVSETTVNLGAWAKKPHNGPTMELPGLGYPIPQRNSTALRHGIMSEGNNDMGTKAAFDCAPEQLQPTRPALAPTLSTASVASGTIGTGGGISTTGNRISSLASIDSSLPGQWPANRVMTPSEWRYAGASQNTSITTGFFAQSQFDGTDDALLSARPATQLTTGVPGAQQRVTSDSHDRSSSRGRFREGSIDRVTSPPTSPRVMSPATSSHGTPIQRDSKKVSPRKGPSPTKVIGNLAERVGIKVTSPTPFETGDEPASPPGKRHWGMRDWMKSSKGNNV